MPNDNRYPWAHKHLLDVDQLSSADVFHLFEVAASLDEVNHRQIKKAPTLKGRTVILFFAENSTRTRTSFDVAGKRLGADTFSLSTTGSSINKGESLRDTALTLEAMNPDVIVIRHSSSGAAQFLAETIDASVINAGDGWHAHPTQALLDAYSLNKAWQGDFRGKNLLLLGDIAHSRVARSNINLLHRLGVNITVCAPRTLLPAGVDTWPVRVSSHLDEASEGQDAIMCLRMQLERQQAGLFPSLAEYSRRYCLSERHLARAAANALVLHPGPLNRGVEITDAVADGERSLILDQVGSGVAIRMALLYLLTNFPEREAN